MRRLDTLECERAAEELRLAVERGEISLEQARPGVQFFLRQGMTEEAQEAFDESCKRLIAGGIFLMLEVNRAQDLEDYVPGDRPEPTDGGIYDDDDEVPFGVEEATGDEEFWLPFDEEVR